MKVRSIALIINIVICFTCVFSQIPENIKTQFIDGKEYYVYTVQPSEGLYRISTNFGVTQDEIIKINPELKDGLKSGQIIFIPKKTATTGPATSSQIPTPSVPTNNNIIKKNDLPAKEPHFYYHKVEKKQTLYAISKQYEVEQSDIIKYNPQASNGVKEGEVLKIPKPEDIYADKKEEKEKEDFSVTYLIHIVEARETLYSISRKYAVKIEDIQKINPNLEVLSIGQELRIPYLNALRTTEVKGGRKTTYIDWSKVPMPPVDSTENVLRIAYLLPLSLESKNDPSVSRFIEFYAGSLKAIYEAKEYNTAIDIFTYDTGKSKEKMEEVFANNEILKKVDLIIGPAYSVQVPVATEFAKTNEVKILIPFTSKVPGIEQNPYVIQFNPGEDTNVDYLKRLLERNFNNMNIILAEIPDVPSTDQTEIEIIKSALKEQRKAYETVVLSNPESTSLESALIKNKKNLIIFNTNKFSAVQPYLKTINQYEDKYDLVILEQYSWKNQAASRPAGVFLSPFKPENEIIRLREYERDFNNLYGWKATSKNPRYDLLGYDLTGYFISLLVDKKVNFNTATSLQPYRDALQSEFNFRRQSTSSGFINQRLYLEETSKK